ncbi:MAG: lamin tail domain-containing protein [Myxococcales bacterium]
MRINEVVPSNASSGRTAQGVYADWVELYNGGSEALDLAGYSLTDDTASPRKTVLGAGLKVGAGATRVLWADGAPELGADHLAFKLSSASGLVAVFDPDGVRVDQTTWSGAVSDEAWARFPDGTGAFAWCHPATPQSANGSTCPAEEETP